MAKKKSKSIFKLAARAVAAYYTAGASETYYAKARAMKSQPAQPLLDYAQGMGYGAPAVPQAQGFLPLILAGAGAAVAAYPGARQIYEDVSGVDEDEYRDWDEDDDYDEEY